MNSILRIWDKTTDNLYAYKNVIRHGFNGALLVFLSVLMAGFTLERLLVENFTQVTARTFVAIPFLIVGTFLWFLSLRRSIFE